MQGVWVYLDLNNNQTRDSGEQATQTDEWGNYAIPDICGGVPQPSGKLRIEVPSGWSQTFPAGDSYDANPGNPVAGLNFGIKPANKSTISLAANYSVYEGQTLTFTATYAFVNGADPSGVDLTATVEKDTGRAPNGNEVNLAASPAYRKDQQGRQGDVHH